MSLLALRQLQRKTEMALKIAGDETQGQRINNAVLRGKLDILNALLEEE